MKYCRFLYGGQILYGAVDMRGGNLQIVGLMDAPAEDLRFRVKNKSASSFSHSF
jgi:hypothetical protein